MSRQAEGRAYTCPGRGARALTDRTPRQRNRCKGNVPRSPQLQSARPAPRACVGRGRGRAGIQLRAIRSASASAARRRWVAARQLVRRACTAGRPATAARRVHAGRLGLRQVSRASAVRPCRSARAPDRRPRAPRCAGSAPPACIAINCSSAFRAPSIRPSPAVPRPAAQRERLTRRLPMSWSGPSRLQLRHASSTRPWPSSN